MTKTDIAVVILTEANQNFDQECNEITDISFYFNSIQNFLNIDVLS